MKKILIIIILVTLTSSVNYAIEITEDYTAEELNTYIDALGEEYNEITVETLGESYLGKSIKALRLKNTNTIYDEEIPYNKGIYHFLVLGGVHARERVNPKLLVKQIEYYAEEKLMPENMVIHYIPLVNPDGYDLSLFEGISTEHLESIEDQNYPRWKSNIRGVDINRNFPDVYLDLETLTWKDSWGRVDNKAYISEEPSGKYYFGDFAGSEVETQIMMNYMNRYKFEMFLDYHSQGEVLFASKWFMSDAFNEKTLTLANTIVDLNGYAIPKRTGGYSSGFTSNYMVNRHRVPSITIETTKTRDLPYLSDVEEIKAYEENKDVTLEVFKKAIALNKFGSFKTYDSLGYFFDDYHSEGVAKAYAKIYDLTIKNYVGLPLEHHDDFISEWAVKSIDELIRLDLLSADLMTGYQSDISVRDFLKGLKRINEERYLTYEPTDLVKMLSNNKKMSRIEASYILYTYLDGEQYDIPSVDFKDTHQLFEKYKEAVNFVNYYGLINGKSKDEFTPMKHLTKEEAAIIFLRVFRLDEKEVFSNE